MGRPAAVPVHPTLVLQNLADAGLDNPLGEDSPALPSTEPGIPAALSEGYYPNRDGNPGHPTRSETSTPVSDRTSTTFLSPPLLSDVANVTPSAEPPCVLAPAPPGLQDLVAALSLLPQSPSNRPTRTFPIGGARVLPITPKPLVKVCVLCTGDGVPVLPDTGLILQSLGGVRNVDTEHITIRTRKQIGTALDDFFDLTDIREGTMLILIVSCHGHRGCGSDILLEFKTQDGATVNSRMFQEKITALPEHCTLEIVVDTCLAGGVIPGLRRISTVDPSAPWIMPAGIPGSPATYTPPSGSRPNTKVPASSASSNVEPCTSFFTLGSLKHASPFFEGNQPQYKAQVVVWAASTTSSNIKSYPEEDLPGRPGVYSILIGAIFKYFSSNGPNVTRRDVWENVQKVVEEHNSARRQRDHRKPLEAQASLKREDRIQTPILLTSMDNPDRVLSGLVFQPIKRV